jgi:ferritin
MPATAFVQRLNEQIANEFGASQQYVAIAVYYDAETLPRLAAFFYRQAAEERERAERERRRLLALRRNDHRLHRLAPRWPRRRGS